MISIALLVRWINITPFRNDRLSGSEQSRR